MDHRKKNGIKMVVLLLFSLLNLCAFSTSCLGANLTLNEFREICNIPNSVEIPSALQSIITTDAPVIIRSQNKQYIHIYPTSSTYSYINSYVGNVGWQKNFAFFTAGSSPNTYFYFSPNFTFTSNPNTTWSKNCYVYDVSTQTFSIQTWINFRKGYKFSNDQVGARFGLSINADNQTDTTFKSLATLKAFLMDNLLFAGYNNLVFGDVNVLYRFNGVYEGTDKYNSKFITDLNKFKFTYEAYADNETLNVVNYFYLQKFAPNEAIQVEKDDITYWAGENWFYDRDRIEDFSFSTLINKMETGYIYRLRALSNQHNVSGDLIRTADATSQFFSLNSWKSSEIEVLNIYELLFTDNPSIEDTGGGPSSGGSDGIIDITGIENQIGNLNTSINDLNNFFSGDIGENNSGELNNALQVEIDVEDPTADFFTWFFEQLKECFTVTGNQQLNFSILDNNFTINSDDYILDIPILKNVIGIGSGIFILYGIFKDIRREIEKIKEGKFEEIASEDITANMM